MAASDVSVYQVQLQGVELLAGVSLLEPLTLANSSAAGTLAPAAPAQQALVAELDKSLLLGPRGIEYFSAAVPPEAASFSVPETVALGASGRVDVHHVQAALSDGVDWRYVTASGLISQSYNSDMARNALDDLQAHALWRHAALETRYPLPGDGSGAGQAHQTGLATLSWTPSDGAPVLLVNCRDRLAWCQVSRSGCYIDVRCMHIDGVPLVTLAGPASPQPVINPALAAAFQGFACTSSLAPFTDTAAAAAAAAAAQVSAQLAPQGYLSIQATAQDGDTSAASRLAAGDLLPPLAWISSRSGAAVRFHVFLPDPQPPGAAVSLRLVLPDGDHPPGYFGRRVEAVADVSSVDRDTGSTAVGFTYRPACHYVGVAGGRRDLASHAVSLAVAALVPHRLGDGSWASGGYPSFITNSVLPGLGDSLRDAINEAVAGAFRDLLAAPETQQRLLTDILATNGPLLPHADTTGIFSLPLQQVTTDLYLLMRAGLVVDVVMTPGPDPGPDVVVPLAGLGPGQHRRRVSLREFAILFVAR